MNSSLPTYAKQNAKFAKTPLGEKDNRFRRLGSGRLHQHTALLSYRSHRGILRHQIAKLLLYSWGFQTSFSDFLCCNHWRFDWIGRVWPSSIKLRVRSNSHVRFDFWRRVNSALNLKMLLATNHCLFGITSDNHVCDIKWVTCTIALISPPHIVWWNAATAA